MGLSGLMVGLAGGAVWAETRFTGLFLDVRDAAHESLAAADVLTEEAEQGFGARYQEAIEPIRDRLRAGLDDAGATDAEIRALTVELDIANDRFRDAVHLKVRLEEAMAKARDAATNPADGFGRQYQQELAPVVDLPRELLDDADATIEDAETMGEQLTDALAEYERVRELISSAEHSLYLAGLVKKYAREGFADLDYQPLPPLIEAVEQTLADPEATIRDMENVSERFNDAIHAIGDPLEDRFTDEVNIDSPEYPHGLSADHFEMIDEFPLPREGWRFRKDRPRLGYYENWHAPELDDSDWESIEIEEFWNRFMTERYYGVAWYRTTLYVPEFEDYDALALLFRGVDENGWVWVNGQYVGQQNIGPAGWSRPFQLDVTEVMKPGEQNQITVRVMNTDGSGGIWEPARLIAFEQFTD